MPRKLAPDIWLFGVAVVLLSAGVVMVASASAIVAADRFHDPYFFLKKQVFWALLGAACLWTAIRLDYHRLEGLVLPLLIFAGVLLVLVLVSPFGQAINGTRRWIRLGSVSFQPAELAKLALVVYLAAFLAKKGEAIADFRRGLVPPLAVAGLLALLVLAQPDLGNCLTLVTLTFTLLFLAGGHARHLGFILLAALPPLAVAIWMAPYRLRRIFAFIDPWSDARGSGFQIIQSWLAFGNGGIFCPGIGAPPPKRFFPPEAHTDFLFAVIREELRLVGVLAAIVPLLCIAEILLNLGYGVTGSDQKRSDAVARLAELGAKVFIGHQAENVEGAHVVVYSSAVSRDNVEVQAARHQQIPTIPRAEMLAELMRLKYGIAVAGTHGKTTTTSMVGTLLAEGRLDPTIVVGGRVTSLGSNARLGQGEYLIAEADEADGSFLKLAPTIAVVTTVDAEHLDHYGSLDAIRDAFVAFVNKGPFYGSAGPCPDQPDTQLPPPAIANAD